MKVSGVLSEAARNVSTGTTKAVTWALATTVILTLLTLADVVTIMRIERDVQTFQATAANVHKAPAPNQIDGFGCDALAGVSTIKASGAIRERSTITIDQAPLVPMTAYDVTYGFGRVIGIDNLDVPGVWVEAGLAQLLAVSPGATLSTKDGPLQVAGVYDWPNDGRDIRFSYAILVPVVAAQPFDECWIQAWPIIDDNDKLLRSTQIVTSEAYPILIAQVNRNYGVTMDANRLYSERITWHTIWVAPLFLGLFGFLATWRRRLEYSAALHARQARGAFMLGVAIETAVWALTGAGLTSMIDLVVIRLIGLREIWLVWLGGVIIIWCSLVAGLVGGVCASALIREKGLFRFFKTR
ncbi:MAG: hypothetical protein LBE83_02640 [Propionibacteriaceae bacterium]|jgi:hypothetical protein|nr:hypothetical protein [Propionibacteriaceae bacterium]